MTAMAFVYGGTFGVTITPTSVSGYYAGGGAANVTTGAAAAAGNGGVAPYTYAWARVGTGPYTWAADAPAASTSTFTATAIPQGVADEAVFQVTVTDAAGSTSTGTVAAAAINNTPYFDGSGFGGAFF